MIFCAIDALIFVFPQVNKHNKCAERALLVTDKFVYKLDPKKGFKQMRPGTPLTEVSTQGGTLHLLPPQKKNKTKQNTTLLVRMGHYGQRT